MVKSIKVLLFVCSQIMLFALVQNCGDFRSANEGALERSSNIGDSEGEVMDITVFDGLSLRKIVEHPLYPKKGFAIGYALPMNYSNRNNDASVNCNSTQANPGDAARFGPCYNGREGDIIAHLDFAATEFNMMTPESSLKMLFNQPDDPGVGTGSFNFTYDLTDTDAMIDSLGIAQGNMDLHGHTLIWYAVNPGWFEQINSAAEVEMVMRDRIVELLRHFRGKNMVVWDVVNEAMRDDRGSGFSPSPVLPEHVANFIADKNSPDIFRTENNKWFELLGPDYIRKAFKYARDEINTWAAAERPKLIYNDYAILWKNVKSDAVYELVKHLNSQEKLVDGVGFQGHLWSDFKRNGANGELIHTDSNSQLMTYETVPGNLKRFADLNLELYITEMDVRLRDMEGRDPEAGRTNELPQSEQQDRDQYDIYKTVFSYCLDEPACVALQFWGVTDARSWMSGRQPLLFKGHAVRNSMGEYVFEKKPAYDGIRDALMEFAAKPR